MPSLVRPIALVALALLTACAPSGEPNLPVGQVVDAIRNGSRDPQITPLTAGQQLALGWLHDAGRPGRNFCTGTLIAPQYVVTARHCVEGRSGRTIGFGVGVQPAEPVASFAVQAAIAHPTLDIALLHLAEDAVARVPELEPMAFNREPGWAGLEGSEVEAGGFGETYDPSRSGQYFAVVLLRQFGNEFVVVDGQGRQGICFGDSGGPVMAVNPAGTVVILGVESSGDSSCVDVDRLTRLDIAAGWIDDNLAGIMPEGMCGDLDDLGRCTQNVAEWCENGVVRRQNCDQGGQLCDFVNEEVGYFCTDPPPCGEVDARGVCDGDVVARCRFGRLTFEDCTQLGETCQSDRSGAFCAVGGVEPTPDAAVPDAAVAPDAADPVPDAAMPDPTPDAQLADAEGGSEQVRNDEGCQSAPGGGGSGMSLLGLLAFGALRRRKRTGRQAQ